MSKKTWKIVSQVLVIAAAISIVLAGIGYVGIDIWLASTQWLLVSVVLAAFGIYAKLNA